jgi:hypothetical protein
MQIFTCHPLTALIAGILHLSRLLYLRAISTAQLASLMLKK